MRFFVLATLSLLWISCGGLSNATKQNGRTFLYVGSFTDKQPGTGIHSYSFDRRSGKLMLKDSVTGIINRR